MIPIMVKVTLHNVYKDCGFRKSVGHGWEMGMVRNRIPPRKTWDKIVECETYLSMY